MTPQWNTLSFAELGADQLYAILRLRQEVFVVEQNCVYLDLDNRDQQAVHILCQAEGLVGYQRCLAPDPDCPDSQLGRIVVHPEARGRGLGRELVRRGIEHNRSRWPECDIRINAQSHLQAFYSSLGFTAEGEEYAEDGILHRQMRYTTRD